MDIYRIPKADALATAWNASKPNWVWKGCLRLLEQERTSSDAQPHEQLRLKLELYKREKITLLSESFAEITNEIPWAEVWYNPFQGHEQPYRIANDGSDTITVSSRSSRCYRLIAQIPGTGYHAYEVNSGSKSSVLQVALACQFEDSFAAGSFSESLALYRRRFAAFQDRFHYDQHLSSLRHRIDNMRFSSPDPDDDGDVNGGSDSDNDFGHFVSSYD